MIHKKHVLRGLLYGPGDPLAMLRAEYQGTEDQQVKSPLEKYDPVLIIGLGRHSTRLCTCSCRMSTQNLIERVTVAPGAPGMRKSPLVLPCGSDI